MEINHKNFIPRDVSWLYFNQRVLQEAQDNTVPLIERLRFLGIYSNNLDEFYRVRVASLKRVHSAGKGHTLFQGEPASKILHKIYKIATEDQKRFNVIFKELNTELEKNNIFLLNETQLNTEQQKFVKEYFADKVRPFLVPIMIHKENRFPYLKDRAIYLAIKLINKIKKHEKINYSLVQIPADVMSRYVVLPNVGNKSYIMLLDDVIRFNLKDLYNIFELTQIESYCIKITRDAELDIIPDLHKSYTQNLETSIKNRKKGNPTRFIYDENISKDLLDILLKNINLDENTNLIPGGRYHNFRDFMKFPHLEHKELLNKKLIPLPHRDLIGKPSVMDVIRKKDLLLTFPYQKFSHIIDLLREAAIDPNVTAIKITLYRIAELSNIAQALRAALLNGKEVTAVVELQARFDEENNIYWSEKLQEQGAKMIFGVPGLKVHSKLCLITREEQDKVVNYAYVGTGNFNENTSGVYTDFALLTADIRITDEVNKVFEFLQVNYRVHSFQHLLVSPFTMRSGIYELIDKEVLNAKRKKPAYIWFKLNNLNDPEMIAKLYVAAKAGVKIKLLIRGVCSLMPSEENLSENIEGISIIDRFLEHNRILLFANGGEEKMYISSADMLTRNLDQRTEIACPIYDLSIMREIKKQLEIEWRDNTKARSLNVHKMNHYLKSRSPKKTRSQVEIYNYFNSLISKK